MANIKITVPSVVLTSDRKDVKKALRAAGNEVAAIARKLIKSSQGGPGSPPQNKTGALAASMRARVNSEGTSVQITAAGNGKKGKDFYALILENGGTGSKKKGGKDKRGRDVSGWSMKPHPFLSTAVEKVGGDEALGQRLTDAIVNGISLKTSRKK
jgi:HK97 gp10 family phage protein